MLVTRYIAACFYLCCAVTSNLNPIVQAAESL